MVCYMAFLFCQQHKLHHASAGLVCMTVVLALHRCCANCTASLSGFQVTMYDVLLPTNKENKKNDGQAQEY